METNGSAGQTYEKVRPRRQPRGTRRQRRQILELGREIGVIQEVVVNRAVEYHDPHVLISLESVDNFLELLDHFRPHHVERRIVDRDAPICW
jgi:phospholipid N-methyltransferase